MFDLLPFRPRHLPAEILDSLPAEHPAAIASRRDLRVFNHVLGNARWIASQVSRHTRADTPVLELGAGDGELGCAVHRRHARWDGLDRAPRPASWPSDARWHRCDVNTFAGWAEYPVIAANLFFHHFNNDDLLALGAYISRHAQMLVIGDLRRGRGHQLLFALFARLVRAHSVSLHDGRLSIGAGFRHDELPDRLGLHRDQWEWTVRTTPLGAYRLLAHRRP
jgi:hypothetical protein